MRTLDNRVIGFTWVNVKTNDFYKDVLNYTIQNIKFLPILYFILLSITWYSTRRISKGTKSFVQSILEDATIQTDSQLIPELDTSLTREKTHSRQLRIYESMVHHSTDFIAALDLDFKIVSMNPAAERIFGYLVEEAVGQEAFIVALPEQIEEMKGYFERAKVGEEILLHDVVRKKKDGSIINISIGLSPIRDELGEIIGITSISRDITERKQMEKEMKRLDGLNLIGEMAAGISHEIRNPMTTVRGFLQLLGTKLNLLEYKDFFDLMIDELDRANSIITEFLSLSKNNPVELKKQNLNSILKKDSTYATS